VGFECEGARDDTLQYRIAFPPHFWATPSRREGALGQRGAEHAIYWHAPRFMPHISATRNFPGVALARRVLSPGRYTFGCEIGTLISAACCRMGPGAPGDLAAVYTQSHIEVCVEVIPGRLAAGRDAIPGTKHSPPCTPFCAFSASPETPEHPARKPSH